MFAEGFDLVFGSSGEKQWYAGLLSDCEEDIDGLLSYFHTEDKKCKILSEEETALIPKRVYHNFIRIRDELGIPRADRLYRDDLILVRTTIMSHGNMLVLLSSTKQGLKYILMELTHIHLQITKKSFINIISPHDKKAGKQMTEIIIDEQKYLSIVKDVEDTMSKFDEQGASYEELYELYDRAYSNLDMLIYNALYTKVAE